MTPEELKGLADELGRGRGEDLMLLIIVVNALRKQPSFDNAAFRADIQKVLDGYEGLTDVQRKVLEELI